MRLAKSRQVKWIITILFAYSVVTVAVSIPKIRGWLMAPLVVHDENARAEMAYVMADGYASWERLRAASDLYHLDKVRGICLLEQPGKAGFNFTTGKLDSRTDRERAYLELFGVPQTVITTVTANPDARFGSLEEARSLASSFPDIKSWIVVTSPPHTRRTKLCFTRVFPETTETFVCSAARPSLSAETHSPLWLEYVKLVAYWFVAVP